MINPINPVDQQDPRIQKLIQALKQQGANGQPLFGGAMGRAHGGGGGLRGRADYTRPGFAGINYNPLAAQMAGGAPGLLGLNSGHDNSPARPIDPAAPAPDPLAGGDPTGGVTGYSPPVLGQPWGTGGAVGVADPYDPNHVVLGGPDANSPTGVSPYRDTVGNAAPYRRRGLWDGLY